MMIKNININGFKSCQNTTLNNLGPLVALVGRNGVGKTNILRAIEWFARFAVATDEFRQFEAEVLFSPISMKAELAINDSLFQYEMSFLSKLNTPPSAEMPFAVELRERVDIAESSGNWNLIASRNGADISIPNGNPLRTSPSSPLLSSLETFLPPDDSVVLKIRPLISFLSSVRYYSFEELARPKDRVSIGGWIPEEHYRKWLADYLGTRRSNHSVLMRLLHMSLENTEDFEELKSLLGPNGLGLIDDIKISAQEVALPLPEQGHSGKRTLFWINFIPSGQSGRKRGFDYFDLSFGTRRIIRVLVSLLFDKSSVMLIEHPEDGIHVGLTAKVMGLLRSYSDRSQLILSSHSMAVFDTLDPEEVRFVSMEGGSTQVRQLTQKELEAAHNYMRDEGSLSSFLDFVQQD